MLHSKMCDLVLSRILAVLSEDLNRLRSVIEDRERASIAVKTDRNRELRKSLSDFDLPNSETKSGIYFSKVLSKDSASETKRWADLVHYRPVRRIILNGFSEEEPSTDFNLPDSETKINICSKDSASETEQWPYSRPVEISLNRVFKKKPSGDFDLPDSETKINNCLDEALSKDSASETERWTKNPPVQIFVNNFSKEGPSTRYRKMLRELHTQKYKQITKLAAKNRRLREEKAKIKELEAKLEAENKRFREHCAKLKEMDSLLQAMGRDDGISASKFERDVKPIGYFLEQLHANANANVKSEVDISTFKHPGIFLKQLDANVKSQVDYSDFKFLEKDLGNDLRMVGGFNFPSSLAPILERITETFGDITSDSLQSDCGAMPSYVMFCAAIKEMDDLKLEQVDETKILLWRDAINSALNVQFKVDFAIEHLKKIARAYFGFKAMEEKSNEELKMIDGTGSKIEVPEDYLREAKFFWGKPLSTGLFH